jgi:hypothetical protein
MRSIMLLAAGCLLASASACAPVTSTSQYPTLRSLSRSEQYVLGESRIVAGETLYDALRRTRPNLLRVRPVTGSSSYFPGDVIGVYINGTYAGGMEVLHTLAASNVASVRRRQGVDVSNRFARGFVLEVSLLR